MNSKAKKILLLLLACALLFGASTVQNSLNRDRAALGLTRVQPLENAPPVLAFTTVALGGFRGLISNMLWIRASQLQEEDKFFEMAQLADWITKLEPHFDQVWVYQAWNMAYNISVKFKDFSDRWRWVRRGISLLRDEGLQYNPDSVLIHRELAWFFQHKMGANLDDANMYYKQEWADEMAKIFGGTNGANFDELINPQTPDQKERAQLLRQKYGMDPVLMKELDERYGPLEWRLPEAHAIYWAALGLRQAEEHPDKVKSDDLIQLRRVIYQSMQLSFQRGRLEPNPFSQTFELGPNLAIIPNVVRAYEEAMNDDVENRDHIANAERNLLRQAVYSLYVNNHIPEAARWFKYLGEKFPDKPILDDQTNSFPRNLTLDQYAVACVQVDINETSRDRVKTAIEGLLINSFRSLSMGDEDRAAGFRLLATKVWQNYDQQIAADRRAAIAMPPIQEISESVLRRLLSPEAGMPDEIRSVLLTRLGLPANAFAAPESSTNAVESPNPQQR